MALPANLTARLAGVKAKLDRAEELFDFFDCEWDKWRDREQPWGGEHEVRNERHTLLIRFRIFKPVPLRFSVIAGETVHDMRSALDHLASYLVEAHGRKPTLSTAWPVEPSRIKWRQKVERRSRPWQLWRKKGAGPLAGIPQGSDAWALIEGSQPYIRSDETRNDPLWSLHQLWNADKHRALNLLPFYVDDPAQILRQTTFTPAIQPISSKALAPVNRPLEDGTLLARFDFPGPLPQMEMDMKVPFEVALGDQQSVHDRGALRDTLHILRELYEAVKALPYPP